MSQKASRLPSARDRLLKNKKDIKELYALGRQRITQRTIQPPARGASSPRGNTAPSGNFLKTEGDTMIGPIAFDPVLVSIVDNVGQPDDDSINISRNTGNNPPDYSTYVLVTPVGVDDDLRVIFGAAFNGQLLYLQGTATTTIRLQNGDVANGGNIVTPDGSEFAILGAKIVTLIFDPTVSPSAGVQGAWRILNSRGIAERDIIHAKLGADESGLGAGDRIGFDTIIDGVQTGVTISATPGIFESFSVGRTYILEAAVQANFSSNSGDAQYQWFDITNAVFIGNQGGVVAITGSGGGNRIDEQQTAVAIVSPTVAGQQYELRIITESNLLDIQQEQSYAFIREEGGIGFGGGAGGGGINFPILYPIDAFGTAPVAPTTTDIDLSLTTAHVHTLDTVGDIVINFTMPPAGLLNITGELIITTDAAGSTVTFTQTTQPSSSFVLAALTRTIITFQSSDMGATFDVFAAGQATGGGGATALNDLTDVTLSGVAINDIFQFNGSFWINKQSFNFGAGPFSSTGFLRYTNDDILLGARNPLNTGDLQLKATALSVLDWTDSGDTVVTIQARTQHPVNPDNIINMTVGSGTGSDALLQTNVDRLRFSVGTGVLPMDLDDSSQSLQLTNYAYTILDSVSGKLLSITNLGGVLGTEVRAVDRFRLLLSGVTILDIDDASNAVIINDFSLNVFNTASAENFSITNLGAGLGTTLQAVEFLKFNLGGTEGGRFEDSTNSFQLLNAYRLSIIDAGTSKQLDIFNLGTTLGGVINAIDQFRVQLSAVDLLKLDRQIAGQTRATIQVPSAGTNISVLNLDSTHVSEADRDGLIAQQAGDIGALLFFTESLRMRWSVDTEVLLEQMVLERASADETHLIIRENLLGTGNLVFDFFNNPPTAIAGTIGELRFSSKDNASQIHIYAQVRGTTINVVNGNEDGGLGLEVAINGAVTPVFNIAGTSVGGEIGFFNVGTNARQTVTGSRGGNVALASFLTALENYGLIIDSTTA